MSQYFKSIRELNQALIRNETSVREICKESLRCIDENKTLNAFIRVCQNEAQEQARRLDTDRASLTKSHADNPLLGVPISIKDNFCTENIATTCASRMLENFIPPYTATAVNRLLKLGCLMMGKTNMDEFAMGSSSTTSYYGAAANFHKRHLVPETPSLSATASWHMAGGSSTGSAISVSSGSCLVSLGTDTGGSTRQPASLNNVVGFKPSYGLISRFGLIPLVHCLDVVSIFANSVDDVRLVFNAIIGQDTNDMTSLDHRKVLKDCGKFDHLCDGQQKGSHKLSLRLGVPRQFISKSDISPDVSLQFEKTITKISSIDSSQNLKVSVIGLDLPSSSLATECYTIISCAEIASNMSCYDGIKFGSAVDPNSLETFTRDAFYKANRDEGFGAEVKKRILLGNYFMLSENRQRYLARANQLRRVIYDEFARVFDENNIDAILMPSTPTTSQTYQQWLMKSNENKLFHEDYFLIPANLANLPSISLPNGFSPDGLPIGLQVLCNKYRDIDLLAIAKFLEGYLFTK